MESTYDDKKIIPNPGDRDTPLFTSFERIRDRLPSLEGEAGKTLKVSDDEEHCEWVTGGSGGSVGFADIVGEPSDNTKLKTDLDTKLTKSPKSADFKIGVDSNGRLYIDV